MTHDVVIRDARVSLERGPKARDVAIDGGVIVAMGEHLAEGLHEVDANGGLLLPGLVDAHVHYREPGLEEMEGFETGTLASAHGGATTVFECQNNAPLMTTPERLRQKLDAVRRRSRVRIGLHASANAETAGRLAGLTELGVGFKLFLSPAYGERGVDADHLLRMLFEEAARLDRLIAVSPEDRATIERAVMKHGDAGAAVWGWARPPAAELVACERVLKLAEETGARLHITPLSTAGGVDLIADARQRGIRVTAGTFPHFLLFCHDDVVARGGLLKVNPSIKGTIDRERLREAVAEGLIDVIESGHAPHLPESKSAPFGECPSGISTADVFLPALMELLAAGVLADIEALLERACRAPATLYGARAADSVKVGADADLVLVEETAWTPNAGDFCSRASASPYVGHPFPARVVGTWVGGRRVWPAT